MRSVEEQVEYILKNIFDSNGIRWYAKTENTGNHSIDTALKSAESKSGGSGHNYPDIKLVMTHAGRCIPVMIEAKGYANRLEIWNDYDNDDLAVDSNSVVNYAVNGAYHYGLAILKNSGLQEVICVGIVGCEKDNGRIGAECRAYYVSKHNFYVPKLISEITVSDWSLFKTENVSKLFAVCNTLNMSDEEREFVVKQAETALEQRVKNIHQSIYDNIYLKMAFTTNEKLYLFCGLIMAGLSADGLPDFDIQRLMSLDNELSNDGVEILSRIKLFLNFKGSVCDKSESILNLLRPVFTRNVLWEPHAGESVLKSLFLQVKEDIIPLLESEMHLDVTGRILNSLNDWVHIDNDKANDVVLTPRYVTRLMVELTRVNMNSYVIDTAMGSGGFLVAAMDYMIRDAKERIIDVNELAEKIKHIKEHQLLGYEILPNIYMLAVLNMILMGDGSSQIKNMDSHSELFSHTVDSNYPADVFLLNPPYGAPGNGLNFVEEAVSQMDKGYACVLIQDSCGSGKGIPYTTDILDKVSLVASIKMPADLFSGKSSVQTHIYLFKVGVAHDPDDLVTFIDFSEDGYTRSNRKKSTQDVNLKDTDNAKARYAEVVARVLGKKAETSYYTEANGKLIRDTITLNGNDWNFGQHQKVDTRPTEDDFKAVVANYLSWKVSQLMKGVG